MLLVADRGIEAAGYAARATRSLDAKGIASFPLHDIDANPDARVVEDLTFVARVFVELQEKRHLTDCDNSSVWDRPDALALVALAEDAFKRWAAIRNEPVAQAYLLSLLIKKRD